MSREYKVQRRPREDPGASAVDDERAWRVHNEGILPCCPRSYGSELHFVSVAFA